MSIRMVSAKRDELKRLVATYVVVHADEKTCLELEARVTVDPTRGVFISMNLESHMAVKANDAWNLLARRLQRMAEAIMERSITSESLILPLFEEPASAANLSIVNAERGDEA